MYDGVEDLAQSETKSRCPADVLILTNNTKFCQQFMFIKGITQLAQKLGKIFC